MQRGIEQTDGDGQAGHDLEDRGEVGALFGEELGERGAAAFLVAGQDHLADRGDAGGVEEHVLGTTQADALGAEVACRLAVERSLGIGADLQAADAVGPFHQRAEVARQFGLHGRNLAPPSPPR